MRNKISLDIVYLYDKNLGANITKQITNYFQDKKLSFKKFPVDTDNSRIIECLRPIKFEYIYIDSKYLSLFLIKLIKKNFKNVKIILRHHSFTKNNHRYKLFRLSTNILKKYIALYLVNELHCSSEYDIQNIWLKVPFMNRNKLKKIKYIPYYIVPEIEKYKNLTTNNTISIKLNSIDVFNIIKAIYFGITIYIDKKESMKVPFMFHPYIKYSNIKDKKMPTVTYSNEKNKSNFSISHLNDLNKKLVYNRLDKLKF